MYFRLAIKGKIGTTEVWSVNPAFHFNAAIAPTWDQASGDAIVAALITGITNASLPTDLRVLLSSSGTITGYRLEGRDEDESLLGVSEGIYAVPLVGTGTMSKTPQAAVVCSLRTTTPGASGRGRIYWPAVGAGITAGDGRMASPGTSSTATAFKALLSSVSTIITANAGVFPFTSVILAVRSQRDHASRTVNRLQVGDVIDTQRRRRDALPENYASTNYP